MNALPMERDRDFARADGDWAWETDDRLSITGLCNRFAGAVGQPPHIFFGRPMSDLGPPPPEMTASFAQKVAFHALPLTVGGESGVPFALSGAPSLDGNGHFTGFRGTAIRSIPAADAATRSAFLSNINHEFRTPLNAIIGFAEAMDAGLHGPLSERYSSYARDIAQAGRHLMSLVGDILDASAIEQGDARIELSKVDVSAALGIAASIVSIDAEARLVEVVRRPVGASLRVIADERRLCQILVNLLGNAVKFLPEGGRVELGARPLDDGRIAIEVDDNGPGIPPGDHHRIFEKFERLQADPFVRRNGAGLGLAIARELALLMDGTLGVDSAPGEGARFTLTLPGV